MGTVNLGGELRTAAKREQTQAQLDRIEGLEGNVLKFGEHQPLAPTPQVTRHLPVPCPACNKALLAGLLYHVFISADSDRFMVWAEGVCPKCMSKQAVIWDPLDAGSAQAIATAEAEREALVREWVLELSGVPKQAVVA